jgi:hypothetical protein
MTQRSGWRSKREKQAEYQADYRFNRAGGGADKQLVADGGPGADDAAQRVAMKPARIQGAQRVAMEAGGSEQLLAAAIALSPAKLAAKSGSYVAAALSTGGAEQLVAAATTLSRAELVDKSYMYL